MGFDDRPNIVLVIADDMGYGDVGFLNPNSKIPTPNMDRIADEGTSFTDAHAASSVCTPSRYSILTGRYCWRSNLPYGVLAGYEPPLIESDRLTIGSMLRGAGYATAAFGKWHLGLGFTAREGAEIDFTKPLPWPSPDKSFEEQIDFQARLWGGPIDLGFETFYGTSGCPTCQPPYGWIDGDRFVEPPDVYEDQFPYTGRPGMKSRSWSHRDADPVIAAKSTEFIENADPDRPFFLYMGLDAPHEPCTDDVIPEFAIRKSAAGPRGDLVWLVDNIVGQVDDALERRGLRENTLLIVTSDNGALPGDRILEANGREIYRDYGHAASGPWRGFKAHIWEGGHREPLIARWPGHVPERRSSEALVCLMDLLASIASLVRIPLPDDAAEDSFDLSGVLLGRTDKSPRQSMISHSQKGVFSVRKAQWKVIFGTKGSGGWPPPRGGPPDPDSPGQLYDLSVDPTEQDDLWAERKDIASELSDLLGEARSRDRTAPPHNS